MGWSAGIAEWVENETAFVSVVFSWMVQQAYMRCVWLKSAGYHVKVGGPAVYLNNYIFSEFDMTGRVDALIHHNKNAVFTSRGCIRKCGFCLVPKAEGALFELDDWDVKPIICDNNLLATSTTHFDKVIDRLLEARIKGIDFNQGLDARLLSEHHARRFAELPKDTIIRLAWDDIRTEVQYMSAFEILVNAGVLPKQIRTYVLIGYNDTPDDAFYRLEKIRELGALPSPMRFQPLNAVRKNEFVGENWTERELRDFMRYYSRLNQLGFIPFAEYKGAL